MNDNPNKRYHLTRLYEYVGKEAGPVKEMVDIFLHSTPEILDQMAEAAENQDFEIIYKTAHMLKPSLHIFGIDDMYNPVREIELLAKKKENFNAIYLLIAQLQLRMEFVIQQLRDDFDIQ
ncbi:MAG: Hpt domain-containing protein [Bacteroidetes bacterium]|jgi:HPt (histidine-containing phosphotransfer) domain-containing protein|nr:Hpt domain-containing protein [Bacteroidota bacterium]